MLDHYTGSYLITQGLTQGTFLWSEGDVTKEAGSESAALLASKMEQGAEARTASQLLKAGEGKEMDSI